jgi:hypothetical protein
MNQTRLVKDVCVQSVRAALCVTMMGAVLAGCGGKEANDPPVATPSFAISRARAPIGSPVTLTYRFQVAPDAKIDGDYRVFVHMLTPDGEQMWTDDHFPTTPTSQWKPGEIIEYSRTVFVPNYPHVGGAEVRLGLYSDTGTSRVEIPASSGVQGPGEMMTWDGFRLVTSATVRSSFRRTSGSPPSSFTYRARL